VPGKNYIRAFSRRANPQAFPNVEIATPASPGSGLSNHPPQLLTPAQVVRRHPWLLTKQNIPYGKLAFHGQFPHKVYSVPLRRLVCNFAGAVAWENCRLMCNPEMAAK